jgi:hypothetical protein
MKRHHIKNLIIITSIVFFISCAASGPLFKKVDTIPDSKGLIYVYRPYQFAGSGISYKVYANGIAIGKLQTGGYLPFISDTGEIEIMAKTEAKATLNLLVNSGDVLYVKGGIGMGFFVGHPKLSEVPKEQGESEIPQCKLLPIISQSE